MNIFYSIISVAFFLLGYLIERENEKGVGLSLLIGLGIGIFWPVIIAAAAVYLLIGRLKKKNNDEEEVVEDPSSLTPEQAKELIERLRSNTATPEEKVEEVETDKEWEEINPEEANQ